MPIIACGINHKTAPVALREQVVFSLEKLPFYLNDLIVNEGIQDAVILSTCNRSELYCDAQDVGNMLDWFCRQHQLPLTQLDSVLFVYENQAAIKHIMQVACGLDSMVLGEAQILGQMKAAFSESCAAGSVGPLFNRLFQQVFSVAKEVRTNTAIGACPVSVASAAVSLTKQILPDLSAASILLIGAGDTVNLVLRHLQSYAVKRLLMANRSVDKASQLAESYHGEVVAFDKLALALEYVDVVVTATSSIVPIITKPMLQSALAARQGKPLFIIDIAVPRDVDPAVTELVNIHLYCIDDLKMIIQHNMRGREHAAEKAHEVITKKCQDFSIWLHSLDLVAATIRAYRKQIEDMCYAELAKATHQLQIGDDPAQVLASFAHSYTNKLLHTPSVQLRQAGYEGRLDLLQLAQQLFAIPMPESELL